MPLIHYYLELFYKPRTKYLISMNAEILFIKNQLFKYVIVSGYDNFTDVSVSFIMLSSISSRTAILRLKY